MPGQGGRVFLFLQGPHGPFFRALAAALLAGGDAVRRIAFHAADEAEWSPELGALDPWLGEPEPYPAWLARYLARHRVTDILLYGASRPWHAWARRIARAHGITCHCFEEGYLRPHWVTYERGGSNGESPLMALSIEEMAGALEGLPEPSSDRREGWGALGAHMRWSAWHHAHLALPSRRYGAWRNPRGVSVWREGANYAMRLAGAPLARAASGRRLKRLVALGRPWHLALLQLPFDSSFRAYSELRSGREFVEACVEAFRRGARSGELLVFRTHPLDDGRERLGRLIRALRRRPELAGRVFLLDGRIPLGPLLDGARSVITVNSTAIQFALDRGLPVRALGRGVFVRPELVSSQPLDAFLARPSPPAPLAWRTMRHFLLLTSQVEGSFYSHRGIRRLLATLPGMIRAERDPYERLLTQAAARAATGEPDHIDAMAAG